MNYSTKLMLTALAATTVICADAQVTTSAINGLVLDDNNGRSLYDSRYAYWWTV